jgi:hypothetical protein
VIVTLHYVIVKSQNRKEPSAAGKDMARKKSLLSADIPVTNVKIF